MAKAARLVAETKAKVEELRAKVAGMKGKAYASDRSELNREIRDLEDDDAYLDALKVVDANPGAAKAASTPPRGGGRGRLNGCGVGRGAPTEPPLGLGW